MHHPLFTTKEHTPIATSLVPHDASYYGKCAVAGVLACGATHTFLTPLDVVKCNLQVFPSKYTGLVQGFRLVAAEEGLVGLYKGWAPTALGYSAQGFCKYGLYEVFKDAYSAVLGDVVPSGGIYLAASASAEVIADVALCPIEMVKVKVQTSPVGTFLTAIKPAVAAMRANAAETRFPFGSVVPLWSRQIPYTLAKFFFFEKVVEAFYTHVFTAPKESYPKPRRDLASGYLAGVIWAVVSHPADSVVSLLAKAEHKGKSVPTIVAETGLTNLATRGLGSRIPIIGTLTGLPWWIYDAFKSACGMGTTGGIAKR
ncbi:Mitochondrial Carrier (MC) Family [Achlya hypogyna]|uniref:Mitochondrial Carrier (MC) Family n=1 Tax=Achlya hypogyna TaxID=1202772 RepID=A0A1V9ZS14_ACHHY|nr:Mitochondrial Carrier (MC) Family [Achlya hypogyna]